MGTCAVSIKESVNSDMESLRGSDLDWVLGEHGSKVEILRLRL
jgi:hypothetical protein